MLPYAVFPGSFVSARILSVLYASQDLNSSVFHSFVQVELGKRVFELGGDSFDSFFGEANTHER